MKDSGIAFMNDVSTSSHVNWRRSERACCGKSGLISNKNRCLIWFPNCDADGFWNHIHDLPAHRRANCRVPLSQLQIFQQCS